MTKTQITPLDVENTFGDDEIIVSKTNLKGHITYVNEVFCRVAEAPASDLIGQPHSIIRHPDMPRTIFHFLWQQIENKKEIFAYVKNMAKSGNYYWVFAHVTPTIDTSGNIVSFHSSRRTAKKKAVAKISELYKEIIAIEQSHSNRKEGMEAGFAFLVNLLEENGIDYDEFVWGLRD